MIRWRGATWAALATVLGAACAWGVAPPLDAAGVNVKATKDHIDFLVGTDLVTTYRIGPDVAKPYFWPLNAPGGVPVTRAWPIEKDHPGEQTDHVHQKSGWFCHGDVIPEGIELKQKIKGIEGVDFWSETEGHGVIVCVKVGEAQQSKLQARIVTDNEWRTADGVKVLDEKRTITLYLVNDARLLVLDSDLYASVCPITFGDTKEGSMGVRVRTEITEEKGKGKLTNADGKTGEKGDDGVWGRVSAWCDDSGPLDGKTAGIAILADPGNPYPSSWHARGYGLLAANPFGRDKAGFPAMKGKTDLVKMAKGDHLKFRYGILLHDGDVKDGKVAECYERFVKLKE
jgi:Methane oxygenase PmoA